MMNIKPPIWNAKFKQRLQRVALGVLDSPGLAEEIVQEAYLRLLECESDTIENPAHWLLTVTRNLAIDKARRLTRERELLLLLPGLDLTEQFEAPHEIENRLAQLIACLIKVSDSQTACIVLLHVVFGVSYEDIATICDRSPAACRQTVSRTLRKCFTEVDSHVDDEDAEETSIFVHAILDASMTPLIENLMIENLGGALTVNLSGVLFGYARGCRIRPPNNTGVIRQAFVINTTGVQWILIRDGRVWCVLGDTAQPAVSSNHTLIL